MRRIILAVTLSLITLVSIADEGMWLLPLIKEYNISAMKGLGLKLDANQIYSPTEVSIKDAVVIFGRGCTGSIISSKGMVLTNHHCGYDGIQQLSSTSNDYLSDGFWAKTHEEELHIPDLSVSLLISIEDVTGLVNNILNPEMPEEERLLAIDAISDSITTARAEGNRYRVNLQSFYGGNAFYLLVYETFNDVRLVGTPPSSIGRFGADTDNWTWPRHTGDFALYRIYADSSNKPAHYSPNNLPYTPKYHLPVSVGGVNEDDFTMTLGYPGGTMRYSTSWEVEETQSIINTTRAAIRELRQEILLHQMLADESIRIKYSSKYARSTNYWKYSIGQNQSLRNLDVVNSKRGAEQEFMEWVKANPTRNQMYGQALNYIEGAIDQRAELVNASQYVRESLLLGVELFMFANRARNLHRVLSDSLEAFISQRAESYRELAQRFYRDFDINTDMKVAQVMLPLFINNIEQGFYPSFVAIIDREFDGNIDSLINKIYSQSIFTDSLKLWEFLDSPSLEVLENDLAFIVGRSIWDAYIDILDNLDSVNLSYRKGHRLYVAGILEKNSGQPSYPDANFSMRLSYGQIKSYYPRDAVYYNYYTTLTGVMEKEDPNNWEFIVPEKLKELYRTKDFGPYAQADGRMPIGFVSNNDITGGNSGSPVLNAYGHVIGCAFDGNWEAMSGDIIFEPQLQRTISVDIRYVLFVIDRFADAGHLIKELTLVE